MKKYLIKMLLPMIMNMLIDALQSLSRKSSNTVDDLVVGVILANKDKIIDEIKLNL
jgi:hypothetical protein